MREETLGGLTVRITGGTDREGGGDGPVVVLMHGFGAPGTDLVGLWRVLDVPQRVRFVFPEAPHALPGYFGGRAWWPLPMAEIEQAMAAGRARDFASEDPSGLAEARAGVVSMLDAIEEQLSVPADQLVLGGFSQGSMLACDVAFTTARPLAGLVVLSGTLLAEARWAAGMPARAGLPVFQSHGRLDPLLGFGQAERLRDRMVAAGLDVAFVPFSGAHEIPLVALAGLQTFLRERFPEA